MAYTRENPSPRYRGLLDQYRRLHEEGERFLGIAAQDTFPGQSLLPQAQRIKRLIALTGALAILDYGCGKGRQYLPMPIRFPGTPGEWESVADYWDVDNVYLYDPGFAPFAKRPQERFDGVVCTDVLEHCPEEDLAWIVGDLFGFAQRFVFANVACFPARAAPQAGASWLGLAISLEALERKSEAAEAYRRAVATESLAAEVRDYAEQRARALQ